MIFGGNGDEKRVKTGEELENEAKNDDYTIRRRFRYFLLFIACAFITYLVALICFEISSNSSIRDYAVRTLVQSLPGIAVGVAAVLKIKAN